MPFQKYVPWNNAQGTLLAGISAGAGTMILGSGQGDRFPSTFPFLCEVKQNDAVAPYAVLKREIVKVTGRTGDTLTMTRSAGTCLPNDASNTPGTTAFSFSSGDTVTLTVTAETIKDIQDEVETKLPTVWGIRTGFGVDTTVVVNRTTGDEESKAVTDWTIPISTDIVRFQKVSGDYEDILYSAILADMQSGSWAKALAGEAIAIRDSVFIESVTTFSLATSQQPISYSALNTRIELPVFWSGTSASTFKLALKKTWTPAQNLNFRIETDSAGSPSGTLFHTNGTSSITAASLTTSFVDTTVTLTGSITVPYGTKVWIVLYSGTYGSEPLSPTNYYSVGVHANSEIASIYKTTRYNGTTHTSTPVTQTATWTWETSVWVFASTTVNYTAISTCKITQLIKSSNTSTASSPTCTITQWTKTVTATFATHTATFSSPIILTPWAFTVTLTYPSNSNCYESTANWTTSDLLVVTSGSAVVRDIRSITAVELLPIPYISSTWFQLSSLAKTDSTLGYKLGFLPKIATAAYAQGVDANTILGGPIDYPGLTEGGIYFVSTAGAISTTPGTVKMPIGIATGGKLNIWRFDTGITQQLSLGASVTSAPFYHHGWAVTVINTAWTVQMQTSPDNITWTNFFNVTTVSTISLNTPQGYVRGVTSAGWACTIYN